MNALNNFEPSRERICEMGNKRSHSHKRSHNSVNPIKIEAARRGYQYLDAHLPTETIQQIFLTQLRLHKPCMADRKTWDRFNEHIDEIQSEIDDIVGFDSTRFDSIPTELSIFQNPAILQQPIVSFMFESDKRELIARKRAEKVNSWYGMKIVDAVK